MVLEASRRIGLSALILGLTFLVVLFSTWCGSINPDLPNFPLIKQSLVTMLFFGVIIGPVGATVGIVLGIISLFIPSTYKKKEETTES